jgi:hypothetical protein
MAPIVHGLEAEYYGRVTFIYLDASDPATREFQRELGFAVQPEFYLLDGSGTVLNKWFGFQEADVFRSQFNLYPTSD